MPPNTKKCEKCGAVDDSGLTPRTNSFLCDQHDWKPTPAVEDWEIEFEKEFRREDGLLDIGKYDDEIVKDFIRSLREADRKRIVEEQHKIRENEMADIGNLQHRCPQCGKETSTRMTWKESMRINALWGRCFECVSKDNNSNSPATH